MVYSEWDCKGIVGGPVTIEKPHKTLSAFWEGDMSVVRCMDCIGIMTAITIVARETILGEAVACERWLGFMVMQRVRSSGFTV